MSYRGWHFFSLNIVGHKTWVVSLKRSLNSSHIEVNIRDLQDKHHGEVINSLELQRKNLQGKYYQATAPL